ncbi:helix-turn-helix domain-containing protein [Winogradskyella ouciana]|uniref:helix-turn-helix domain-containing protein n=1 Tax=Winogradskyella ouciana TaxID=2608631 RepID=UPI003D2A7737
MDKKKKKEELKVKRQVAEEVATQNKRQFLSMLSTRLKGETHGMSKYSLSKIAHISESTISRFFSQETDLTLTNFFKICYALKLNPYLIPEELDSEEFRTFDANYHEYISKTYFNNKK